VVGGLFTVLAEVAPTLHKRDADFTVDNGLLQALATQLSSPRFPGPAYLTAMVRRVQIEKRLPQEWLDTAARVNARVQIIDTAKLRFLADGVQPIDSFAFTLAALRQAHDIEVQRATKVATTNEVEFKDRYLDREVAWNGLMLMDVGPEKKGKKKSYDDGTIVARMELIPPKDDGNPFHFQIDAERMLKGPPKKVIIRVNARLADKQYIDLYKLPKKTRVMVRGRLWGMNKNVTEMELRDAVLFIDRDWSEGAVLADPNAVAQCPAAINELTGTASGAMQPGGFGQRK
jgi:hypothetical protein